jgi:hypothetical protein
MVHKTRRPEDPKTRRPEDVFVRNGYIQPGELRHVSDKIIEHADIFNLIILIQAIMKSHAAELI